MARTKPTIIYKNLELFRGRSAASKSKAAVMKAPPPGTATRRTIIRRNQDIESEDDSEYESEEDLKYDELEDQNNPIERSEEELECSELDDEEYPPISRKQDAGPSLANVTERAGTKKSNSNRM